MNYDYIQQTLFWSFVPATVTSMIQSLLYRVAPKRSAAKGTLAYRTHYNWIYTLIITGYLIFSVLQMDHDVKRNYYDVLNLPVGFQNKDLKVNYRALSLQYHPDKQPHLSNEEREAVHEVYIVIRNAYETLKSPASRHAYEKLKDGMKDCNTCRTEKDYLYHGFTMYTAFYGITLSVMLVMGSLSASHASQFWKYVLIFTTGTLEAVMLVSSSDPFHGTFFPWRTTAERIAILRSLSLALYMTISQLGPLHFPAALDGRSLRRLLVDLNNVTDMQTKESKMAFQSSFTPFVEDASLVQQLHRRMEKLALDTKLESGISKLRSKTQ